MLLLPSFRGHQVGITASVGRKLESPVINRSIIILQEHKFVLKPVSLLKALKRDRSRRPLYSENSVFRTPNNPNRLTYQKIIGSSKNYKYNLIIVFPCSKNEFLWNTTACVNGPASLGGETRLRLPQARRVVERPQVLVVVCIQNVFVKFLNK
jgi:hypothetical protein